MKTEMEKVKEKAWDTLVDGHHTNEEHNFMRMGFDVGWEERGKIGVQAPGDVETPLFGSPTKQRMWSAFMFRGNPQSSYHLRDLLNLFEAAWKALFSSNDSNSDLVQKLRHISQYACDSDSTRQDLATCGKAANRIEALEALCKELHSELDYQRTGLHENIELAQKIQEVLESE
jgi:hypothetical protein